jgi:solute carrier family 50 (sugar transporter)
MQRLETVHRTTPLLLLLVLLFSSARVNCVSSLLEKLPISFHRSPTESKSIPYSLYHRPPSTTSTLPADKNTGTLVPHLSLSTTTVIPLHLIRGGGSVGSTFMMESSWWLTWCGTLAPFASLVVFLAPVPTMTQIGRDKTVGGLPLLPYSTMVASTFVWIMYGILKSEPKVYVTNLVGFACGLLYCWNFIKNLPMDRSKVNLPGSLRTHYQGVGLICATTLALASFNAREIAIPIIGLMGVIFCVVMFASPLSVMKSVIQTRSARSIPLPFTIASVVNCLLWSVLGIFQMKDLNIALPNVLGLACSVLQVALKLMYGNGDDSTSVKWTSGSELPL